MMLKREKSALRLSQRAERVEYDGFALFESDKKGWLVASDSVNCDCRGGVLKGGLGVTLCLRDDGTVWDLSSAMPEADTYFLLPQKQSDGSYTEKLGYISKYGTVFLYNEEKDTLSSRHAFSGRMKPLTTMDGDGIVRMAFVGNDGVYLYNEEEGMTATEIGRALPVGCVLKNRLFCAIAPFTIAYCAPLAPKDFSNTVDDSGSISLPREAGEIVALIALGDCVYIFYQYGISKLTPSGAAREFTVETVGYRGGLIFGESVGVSGEKIFFLASDGLYSFDGRGAKRTCENLTIKPIEAGQVCAHAENEGYYFLRFTAEDGEERGVVVDGESEEGYFAFAAKGLSSWRGKTYCFIDSAFHIVKPNAELPLSAKHSFVAENISFGAEGLKTLKTLRFFGEGRIVVTLSNGRRSKRTELTLGGGFADMRAYMRGERFTLSIVLKTGALLSGLQAETIKLTGAAKEGFAFTRRSKE